MKYFVAATVSLLVGACQNDISTPFPEGLEPFEDNTVPDTDSLDEVLRTREANADVTGAHGRGLIHTTPAQLWQHALVPEAMDARCSTDQQSITVNDEPQYEFSFLVHYTVNNVVTVEWDDQWRYGIVIGDVDAPVLGMVRHQKIRGSDFVRLSEGTVQILAVPDQPDYAELAFVEHLDAVSGNAQDLVDGMQANYNALLALAHGQPIPSCFR